MALQTLIFAHSRGVYTFPYEGVVSLLYLALRARKEQRSLDSLLDDAGFEPRFLAHLEDGVPWFYKQLLALANGNNDPPKHPEIPSDWSDLILEFWKRSNQSDRESANEIDQPSVFLSHSHRDKGFARNIANAIRDKGISVWLDEAEIGVGESLIEKLSSAIDSVDYLVVILSKASINSNWVKKEIEVALCEEIESKRLKVLPVLKDDVELPMFLRGKKYADFRKPHSRKRALNRLIRTILDRA